MPEIYGSKTSFRCRSISCHLLQIRLLSAHDSLHHNPSPRKPGEPGFFSCDSGFASVSGNEGKRRKHSGCGSPVLGFMPAIMSAKWSRCWPT